MYGVCIVKIFLSYTKNEIMSNEIFGIINLNIIDICHNQYGNYLVQYILQNFWKDSQVNYIKKQIIEKFGDLASEKFSSHICNLFVELSEQNERIWLMNYLVNKGYFGFLSKNKFGSYIINKLMKSLSIGNNNNGGNNSNDNEGNYMFSRNNKNINNNNYKSNYRNYNKYNNNNNLPFKYGY